MLRTRDKICSPNPRGKDGDRRWSPNGRRIVPPPSATRYTVSSPSGSGSGMDIQEQPYQHQTFQENGRSPDQSVDTEAIRAHTVSHSSRLSSTEVLTDRDRFRPKPFIIEPKRWDPVTAVLSASFETAGSFGRAASEMVSRPRQANGVLKSQETDAATLSLKKNTSSRSSSPAQETVLESRRAALDTERGGTVTISSQKPERTRQLVYSSAARSTGRLLLSPVKGLVVDIPLAAAEGMRALPQLYGDHSYSDRKPITDWKSGSIVGAQSFADGIRQGTSDIFSQTFARKKQEGAKGVAKGLGMGLVSLTAKTSAAAIGLIAYPCQGVYRSLYTATHRATRDLVNEAKLEEAEWMHTQAGDSAPDIVQAFLRFRSAL